MTTFALSSDGARIAFESHGTGEPAVVLVHGWACSRRYWDAQLPSLSTDFRAVSLDLAGHGESDTSRRDWTLSAFGADVAAVVRQAALRECILVGHSMGADVTLQAARQLSGAVRGLIWVDQYTQLADFMSEAMVDDRLAPFRANFVGTTRRFVRALFSPAASPGLVERVCAEMAGAPPAIAVPALQATWNHARSVPALLAEVGLPVVAVNAAGAKAERGSLAAHGIEVLEYQGGGHFPMLERPAEFGELLAKAIALLLSRQCDE